MNDRTPEERAEMAESARASLESTVAKLMQMPRFREAYEAGITATTPTSRPVKPVKTLVCPQGHRIIAVSLCADPQWRPVLVCADRGDDFQGVATNGWANLHPDGSYYNVIEGAVDQPRVRLACPDPNCNYSGTWKQDTLLSLFWVALEEDSETIPLPTARLPYPRHGADPSRWCATAVST